MRRRRRADRRGVDDGDVRRGLPPIVTDALGEKVLPVIVTTVPPVVGPLEGAIPVTAGTAPRDVNALRMLAACASGLVTTMSTGLAVCAAVLAVMVVAVSTVTFVAGTPPSDTAAPVWKLAPVIVTVVPPVIGPLAGEIDVSEGAGSRGHGLISCRSTMSNEKNGPVRNPLTRICSTVPDWIDSVPGPGVELGIRLSSPDVASKRPPSSSLATSVRPESVDPVNSATTTSGLVPGPAGRHSATTR